MLQSSGKHDFAHLQASIAVPGAEAQLISPSTASRVPHSLERVWRGDQRPLCAARAIGDSVAAVVPAHVLGVDCCAGPHIRVPARRALCWAECCRHDVGLVPQPASPLPGRPVADSCLLGYDTVSTLVEGCFEVVLVLSRCLTCARVCRCKLGLDNRQDSLLFMGSVHI